MIDRWRGASDVESASISLLSMDEWSGNGGCRSEWGVELHMYDRIPAGSAEE